MSAMTDEVDLADPATFANRDMKAFWRAVRDGSPVYRHAAGPERRPFWVVSRYADVLTVYRDDRHFTSTRGNILVTLLAGGDSAAGKMLAVTDGERHKQLRQILLRAFSPRTLDRVADRVRDNTRRLMARAVMRGGCDFARDIASDIPITTISDLLGVPESDRDFLLSLTKSALSSDDAGAGDQEALLARNEILLYFGDLVEQRRRDPGDDVISVLAASTIDGQPLTEDDIVLNCYSLIIGGDETSRLTMIDAVRTLAGDAAQWQALKDGEVPLGVAIDEVLRWASPTMHFGRTTVTDVEVGGVPIPAGEIVTLWHSSANFDERVFAEPDVFDLHRTPNKHLTFGYGPHYCLGAHLARVEVGEMLSALRTFADDFEIAGPVERIHSNFLTGVSSLPLRLRPDSAELEPYLQASGVSG